jgi:hypothetical protein
MSEEDVQRMIANACFGVGAEREFTGDLRAFLVGQGLPSADVDAICAAPPRLALYRRLVRNNLVGVTERMMPRTRARLGALFEETFDAFLEARGPRTHYLRDVPAEFLAWATARWHGQPEVPAYVRDLAAHELVEFEIGATPSSPLPELAEIALDRALVFADAKRLMRYAHAVHLLPAAVDDRTAPEARDVTLLVYRDAAHCARFLELSPLAAAIIERLFDGEVLGQAVASACASEGHPVSEAILADSATLLADLADRGVLRGAKP